MVDIYHNTLDLVLKSQKEDRLLSEIATETAEKYIRNVAAIKMLK